jgi:hypothetical protein
MLCLMGGSLQLHKQLTERHIESLGLLEYDSCVFGQSVVRMVPSGDFFGKATNGYQRISQLMHQPEGHIVCKFQ